MLAQRKKPAASAIPAVELAERVATAPATPAAVVPPAPPVSPAASATDERKPAAGSATLVASADAPPPTSFNPLFQPVQPGSVVQAAAVPPPTLYPPPPATPSAPPATVMEKKDASPASSLENADLLAIATKSLDISAADLSAWAAAFDAGKKVSGQENALEFTHKETLRAAVWAVAAYYASTNPACCFQVRVIERDQRWQLTLSDTVDALQKYIHDFASRDCSLSADRVQKIIAPLSRLGEDSFCLGKGVDAEGKHEWVHMLFNDEREADAIAFALGVARAARLTSARNPMDYPLVQQTDAAYQDHTNHSYFIRIHASEWPRLTTTLQQLGAAYPDFRDKLSDPPAQRTPGCTLI